MDVAISTSDLHAEGSLMVKNTSAEMSPVARQANEGKLGGRKTRKIAWNRRWGAPTLLTWNTVRSATGNVSKFADGRPSSKFHLQQHRTRFASNKQLIPGQFSLMRLYSSSLHSDRNFNAI